MARVLQAATAVNPNSTYDSKLAIDEARRAAQHDAAKGQVEAEVREDFEHAASRAAPEGAPKLEAAGKELRGKAVDEVLETEHEVARSRGLARLSQFVDYAFVVLYALLAMRFALALLAARSGAGFVRFIVTVTDPFYAPFKGIVGSPRIADGHTVIVSLVVAM